MEFYMHILMHVEYHEKNISIIWSKFHGVPTCFSAMQFNARQWINPIFYSLFIYLAGLHKANKQPAAYLIHGAKIINGAFRSWTKKQVGYKFSFF